MCHSHIHKFSIRIKQVSTHLFVDLSVCTKQMFQLPRGCTESRMDLELLINLVQDRHAIYDPSDHMHHNRDAIAELWKEIAKQMNFKCIFLYFCL